MTVQKQDMQKQGMQKKSVQNNSPETGPQRAGSPQRRDRSAGGVTYRRHGPDGTLQIALIATRGGTRWQLPKGAVEPGETLLQAAQREVWEEVGLETVNEGFLREIDYWYWDTYRKSPPERVHKSVAFFLLRAVGGVLSDASYEVDAVGWFSPAATQAKLSYSGELEVVRAALARLRQTGERGPITGNTPDTAGKLSRETKRKTNRPPNATPGTKSGTTRGTTSGTTPRA